MSYLAGDFEQAVEFFEKATYEADADYKLWGNLADAQRFVEGLDETARLSYEKAIELAKLEIAASAAEGDDLTNLAWYHVNLGDFAIAERYLEGAASMPNRTAEQFYVDALVHTLLGNAEPAEAAILEAKERGISQAILDATPELKDAK
jgi:Flp pilus assembly protein TadD